MLLNWVFYITAQFIDPPQIFLPGQYYYLDDGQSAARNSFLTQKKKIKKLLKFQPNSPIDCPVQISFVSHFSKLIRFIMREQSSIRNRIHRIADTPQRRIPRLLLRM